MIADQEHSARTIAGLKALGARLSIDDFGTGYSSMTYLQKLAADKLKVDMSFVRDMTSNAGNASIVKAITALGHNLGLEIVAEGVETVEQACALRAIGCNTIQGYLISAPLPAEKMTEFLKAYSPLALPATVAR